MLLSEFVFILINRGNISLYKKKYDTNLKVDDTLKLNIHQLSSNSAHMVDIKCDYCNFEFKMKFYSYNKSLSSLNKQSCSNCKYLKIEEINLIKHGVKNPFESDEVKDKIKKTNIEKYGVKNPFESDEIKDRIKKTNLEKYGTEFYTKTKEYKEKSKKTNLEKYGTEFYQGIDEIKDRVKQTNLERYGIDYPSKLNETKYRVKQTNLERYGIDYPSKLNEVKDKIKKTNLEKYGVKNPFESDEIKDKIKKTNLEKYGDTHRYQNNEFRKNNFKICNHENYISYKGNFISLFTCENHEFEISSSNYHSRIARGVPICTVCYPISGNTSIKEKDLVDFIRSIYSGNIIEGYRDCLEIDIYLPDIKLGFEFNGIYYHSDKFKESDYHLKKLIFFKERGIRIINIWEDDWTIKSEIVKSIICNQLNKTLNRISARNCQIVEIVDSKIANNFLDLNHLQGRVNSSLKIGLYYNGELVSLMTFDHFEGRKKMKEDEWNLNRFCTKKNTIVIGGSSKLFKYFIKKHNPKRIISFSDKDWSQGNLYYKMGFCKVYETPPDYKYIISDRRVHKSRFRKSKTGKSESSLDMIKIYDCGKIKFELKFNI